jgi:COP9 signalosome complex subunit 3
MLRLDPSGSIFTSSHVLLARLCLRSRAYAMALPVVDRNISCFATDTDRNHNRRFQFPLCAQRIAITAIITQSTGLSSRLTYRDHLQYFLYCSMIYMGLKRWQNALHFLRIVVASPSVNSVSMVMIEAYKKWVLVSLIENGGVRYLGELIINENVNRVDSLYPFRILSCLILQKSTDHLHALTMHLWMSLDQGI